MPELNFTNVLHKKTKRDYLARVNEFPKAEAAKVAIQFGQEYWDGDRRCGYGGMRYDGRWRAVAEAMARHYRLKAGDRVLDVGCGKGFLLYEFTQVVPGIEIAGLDISRYALENAKEEVKPYLVQGHAAELPYPAQSFDLVVSVTTLHNLYCYELDRSLREIERVARGGKFVCVEAYRTEEEKANLLYWQLTCRMFCTPEEWKWWFARTGYEGDYGFIYFE